MPVVLRLALIVAIALAAFALLRMLAQRSLFYPWRYPQGLWEEQKRIGAEDVWLNTRDGVRIHAWYVRRPEVRLATLHLHGNAGNITLRGVVAEEIVNAGSSVLLLEYRGFGKSDGKPTEEGLYADADAGYDWLLQAGYSPDRIIIHGESLGTAAAVELASRRRCAGLILESPFSSAADVAARILPGVGRFVISGLDSVQRIPLVKAPILIIHGDQDEVISIELGRKLFAAAPEPKEFWTVPGATHNELHQAAGPAFRHRLEAFYKKVASSSPTGYL